jgi:hypothetical protein
MSRINPVSSASGVRVAAQPLSNVYTILLMIGFVSLTLALVMLWITLDTRYGVSFGVSDEGKAALALPAAKMAEQVKYNLALDETDKDIKAWPGGKAPVAPAVVTPTVPAPTPTAPAATTTDAGAAASTAS